MPLAVLSGLGHPRLTEVFRAVDPKDVVLVGVRSLDPGEKRLLKEAGVRVYTMHEVDRLGVARIAEEVLKHLQGLPLHVSLDADVLDPTLAPVVGTPVPGGLTYREAHLLMEILAESGRVQSMDLVEVNPILDERNRTAEMLVGLALSLLGKRIFYATPGRPALFGFARTAEGRPFRRGGEPSPASRPAPPWCRR